jgi:hypothetical protein
MRSGTHVLRSVLSQTPSIFDVGEVLHQDAANFDSHLNFYNFQSKFVSIDHKYILPQWRQWIWDEFISYVEQVYLIDKEKGLESMLLLDIKYIFLNSLDGWATLPATYPWLLYKAIECRYSIIHLNRTDVVRQIVSRLLAEETDQWAMHPGDKPIFKKILVNIDLFRKTVLQYKEERNFVSSLLASYDNKLEVEYETLFPTGGNLKSNYIRKSLERFLGVSINWSDTNFIKQGTYELKDIIVNYDEFINCIDSQPSSC